MRRIALPWRRAQPQRRCHDVYLLLIVSFQDNSDSQYRGFRSNIPALLGLITAFFCFKFVYSRLIQPRLTVRQVTDNLHHIPFSLAFSVCMLVALHGTSVLKIFIILSLNYLIAKTCRGSKVGPAVTWVFNAAVLFLNETQEGYRFASIHPSLQYLVRTRFASCEGTCADANVLSWRK